VDRESTALVPGDIIGLSQSLFSFFPADMFLLSGDCIVNESMLTGESIPVSKVPIKDEDLVRWKERKDVSEESAKSFLYSGTRVVRIRGALVPDGDEGSPALALVVRTGEFRAL
jgi:cation-transporting ATPase 13A2